MVTINQAFEFEGEINAILEMHLHNQNVISIILKILMPVNNPSVPPTRKGVQVMIFVKQTYFYNSYQKMQVCQGK